MSNLHRVVDTATNAVTHGVAAFSLANIFAGFSLSGAVTILSGTVSSLWVIANLYKMFYPAKWEKFINRKQEAKDE